MMMKKQILLAAIALTALAATTSCSNTNECDIKTETVVYIGPQDFSTEDELIFTARNEAIMNELGKECKAGRVYTMEKIFYKEVDDKPLLGFIPYYSEKHHCDIRDLKDVCSIEELLKPLNENDTVFEKLKEGYVLHFPENTGMSGQWLAFVIDSKENPEHILYECPMQLDTIVGNRYGIYNTAHHLEKGERMTFIVSTPSHSKVAGIRCL